MYITVTADDNKYYRTWSSGSTKIEGCICLQCDILPDVDEDKKQFCKLKEDEETTFERIEQPKLKENGEIEFTEEKKDEEGNIIEPAKMVMETIKIPHIKTNYSWLFDEDAYNKYQEELKEKETNKVNIDYEKLRGDLDFLAMEMEVEL